MKEFISKLKHWWYINTTSYEDRMMDATIKRQQRKISQMMDKQREWFQTLKESK